jgi:hypothetical protein
MNHFFIHVLIDSISDILSRFFFLSIQSIHKFIRFGRRCSSKALSACACGYRQRIAGVIWGVTEVKWNLIDFYIGFMGFWGFNIDSEKKREKDSQLTLCEMWKFNLSILLFEERKARDTWENLSRVAEAIFIISTCAWKQNEGKLDETLLLKVEFIMLGYIHQLSDKFHID